MIGGYRRVGVDRASHKMPPLLFRLHRGLRLLLALFWLAPLVCLDAAEVIEADVCIYGGTAGGVAAAVQAARMGKTAVIAEFGNHLGGLTSGGLGATDIGNKAAIGGIAREFYHRIALHYANSNAWRFEQREEYFAHRGGRSTANELSGPDATMWTFEPHVAEDILFQMVNEAKVAVYFQQRLASVKKEGGRITEIAMENGKVYRAAMFIDATYEGDLMAKAGVSYTVGREANAKYNETLNGIRAETPKHQFTVPVDPYLKPGDPGSGLLPFIQPGDGGTPGRGRRARPGLQFPPLLHAGPRQPAAAPSAAQVRPGQIRTSGALPRSARRCAGSTPELKAFWNPIWMPNRKTDINNNGGFSTRLHRRQLRLPRRRLRHPRADLAGARGLRSRLRLFPGHQPARAGEHARRDAEVGPGAGTSSSDTGNWPHQLYVREARRMVSDYVMTEHHCRGHQKADDPVGLGAYRMDSHNCQRIVKGGHAENEGDVQVGGFAPYPISYRSIVPKASECENLLVPICLSATHIAYGSIRMEPVFMILGQSAATAAALAMEGKCSVQKLRYETLRARLLADKQVLEWTARAPAPAGEAERAKR